MSKDVRIEILYYKESTDVSLEFGLHGDYPVRMLSTSCDDIESFFRALKRAVWRSEIIMIIGGYGTREYIPAFIARALSLGVTVPDYKADRIISPEIYSIPDKASPLASSDRRFGGFILESGPQTIISLTEDKDVRLKITKEIIVKYISEHYAVFNLNRYFPGNEAENDMPVTEPTDTSPEMPAEGPEVIPTDAEKAAEIPIAAADSVITDISSVSVAEDVSQPVAADPDDEAIRTEQSETIPQPDITDMEVAEVSDTAEELESTVLPEPSLSEDTPDNEDKSTESTADEPSKPTEIKTEADAVADKYTGRRLSRPEILLDIDPDDLNLGDGLKLGFRPRLRAVRIICIILSVLIALSGAIYILFEKVLPLKVRSKSYYSGISEVFHSFAGSEREAAFKKLREYNAGIDSWLSFGTAGIDHPVVTAGSADSSEYLLSHLPDGSEGSAGTVYSTSHTSAVTPKDNIIIYGSASKGGAFYSIKSLFGSKDVLNPAGFTFTNEHTTMPLSVISVFKASDHKDIDIKKAVSSDRELKEYILKIHGASEYKDETDVYLACPMIVLIIGIDGSEEYVAAAVPSVYARKNSTQTDATVSDNSSSASSSGASSGDKIIIGVNDEYIEFVDKDNDGENVEQTPGGNDDIIILPPKPDTSGSSLAPSSAASSTADPPSPSQSSQVPSSSHESSTISSTPASSTVPSDTSSAPDPEPEPTYDPLLTWDVNLTVTNGDKEITGTASEIVAMIIEAEMGSSYPVEALKAQAAATYSFLITNGAASRSAPYAPMKKALTRCIEATAEAKGTIITYGNAMAQTYYYAYSAGKTACNQHIWQWNNWQNTTAIPYLQSVDSSPDETLSYFATTTTYSSNEVKALIEKMGLSVSGLSKDKWIVPVLYDDNGLYCVRVNIAGKEYSGPDLRNKLFGLYSGSKKKGLKSSAYKVTYDSGSDTFTVVCKGWGHGVGMSQEGAKLYAKDGWSSTQILEHYYKGTTVTKYR